jgi:pyruvate formate lyase activating enzyme
VFDGVTMKANIGGIVDLSTIDFPNSLCSVIFFCGCPFRCPFCHNYKLFLKENCIQVTTKWLLSTLKSNSLIEAVTITGGEPTMQIDVLVEFLKGIKSLGLSTKIDTCGFYPKNIKMLIDGELLDYIAMDIKAPFHPETYGSVVGLPNVGYKIVEKIKDSLRILSEVDIPVEVRTTIVPDLIDGESDVKNIARELKNVDLYVLQQFRPTEGTLDPKFTERPASSRAKLLALAKIAKTYVSDVRIRTIANGEEKI